MRDFEEFYHKCIGLTLSHSVGESRCDYVIRDFDRRKPQPKGGREPNYCPSIQHVVMEYIVTNGFLRLGYRAGAGRITMNRQWIMPDVLAFTDNTPIACEVQASDHVMNSDQRKREFFRRIGASVIWICLNPREYNRIKWGNNVCFLIDKKFINLLAIQSCLGADPFVDFLKPDDHLKLYELLRQNILFSDRELMFDFVSQNCSVRGGTAEDLIRVAMQRLGVVTLT